MNRRKFLSGSLAAGAAMISGLRASRDGLSIFPSAEAAPGVTPYPTLLINLRGGLDPAMHLVATPNGSFGSVTIRNRMSGTSAIKQTASGIRYFTGTVASAGKAQFEAHLPDVALLRSFRAGGTHSHTVSQWFGPFSTFRNVPKKPWGNYVASAFRASGVFVPKPCVLIYPTVDTSTVAALDLVAYSNQSPDPSCAAERALSYSGFYDSVTNTNLPPFARQAPSYALAQGLDGRTYSGAQPDIRSKFESSSKNADNAMKTALSGPAWPPPPNVLSALGITMSDFAKPLTELVVRKMAPQLAFAYQALSKNLSHVVAITNYGFEDSTGWDTHRDNYDSQLRAGQALWSNVGKLVALMKATPSPIVPGKTMFETTNIWIQSEMGRAPGPDAPSVTENGADGTSHWPFGCATFLGGRFKRGIAIGGYTPSWEAMPINPATGATTGNQVMTIENVTATVIKAAGADPAGHLNAAPIDALLNMSA